MPLREYQCDACGHRFEVIQKMSDAPLEVCPKCGGVVHKLQAAPAFHLKGTGWYVTDYAKKDQQGADKKDGDSKESPAPSTDKGETKTDTAKSTPSSDSASSGTSTPTPTPTSTSTPSSTKNS